MSVLGRISVIFGDRFLHLSSGEKILELRLKNSAVVAGTTTPFSRPTIAIYFAHKAGSK